MRIVALSDQHGFLPEIPRCDLLIIAGDICPDGFGQQFAMDAPELQKAWFDHTIRPWLARAPATRTILTWGNHDWCGQRCAFDDHSSAALTIVVDDATRVSNGRRGRRGDHGLGQSVVEPVRRLGVHEGAGRARAGIRRDP